MTFSHLFSLSPYSVYDIIGDETMEYEVTIKIKMDRENALREEVNNILHDVDDMKVLKVQVEELEV